MRKHCGNCANHIEETNQFSDECGKCVTAILPCGEQAAPSHWRALPQTNADRIRAMSDEELAAYWVNCSCICDWCSQKEKCDTETATQERCVTGVLEWLKQPAEEEK